MKVVVDFDLCEANAVCVDQAPEVFKVDENDNLHILIESPPESLRKKVEAIAIPHPLAAKVTVSVGVATAFPYRGHDPEQVIESINNAVTKAQNNGGNRVVTVPLMEN